MLGSKGGDVDKVIVMLVIVPEQGLYLVRINLIGK